MTLSTRATTDAVRHVVIVSHDKPELFDHFTRRFRNTPDTTIVFDREVDRAHLGVDAESWRSIDSLLRVVGYTIVKAH